MGLLTPLTFIAFQLLAVATDVVVLLTLLRLMRRRWPSSRWLEACDTAGRPLMDLMLRTVASCMRGPGDWSISTNIAPWLFLSFLLLIRLCLYGLLRTVAN